MEQEIFEEKIRKIFRAIANDLVASRKIPIATYRLQFNHLFKFSDAKSIVSYLHELGISDCYASPYFLAKKGSLHGYDVLDHNQINPEIGTDEEYNGFIEELKKYEMGQILDIVPNHMNITGSENVWWMDVLENGPSSIYADFFDIDWKPVKVELKNKVLFPLLGDQYGRILENQELNLLFEGEAFFIRYGDRKLPLDPVSYNRILRFGIDDLEKQMGKDHPQLQELLSITTALAHLPYRGEKDREKMMERLREKEIVKKRLWNLCKESEEIRLFIAGNVQIFNGKKGDPKSFDYLDELLNDQSYRLSYWRVATEEINYRRFFDINELAAIKMENPYVFKEVHKLIFRLIRENKVTGLRVDHPDGLYNPVDYFYRLQKECFTQICLRRKDELELQEEIGRLYDEELFKNLSAPLRTPFYVVGEKILTKSERIPDDWPISGEIGYAFLNLLNGIFIETENAKAFDRIYARFIGSKVDYQDLFYEKKKLIMLTAMSSETNTLGNYLNRISEKDRHTRDFTLNSLTIAIRETIACFPVYRTYVTACGVIERDQRYIEQAISRAKRKNPALNVTIFDFLQNVLLLRYPEDFEEPDKLEWLDFAMRFQQVCAPVMAKGLEDTLFYVYNRFVSLNEVGGNPEKFGTTLDAFHGQNIERNKFWPHGLITTSTHDTKRSEDVRARLNVLSEMPDEWNHNMISWSRINKRKKVAVDGQLVPDRNEEYLLYQTLVGAWPIHPMNEPDYGIFIKRIKDYMLKAIREAKVNSSWISPNALYEEALLKFIDAMMDPSHNSFIQDLEAFQKKVSYFGMFNSLSQTLLKITSPGVPDFYQGTEIWDFSLVDPDNRRPVNFDVQKDMLKVLKKKMAAYGSDLPGFASELFRQWENGSIKLYVIYRSLNYRKENRQLFENGTYIPLVSDGSLKEHVCAYARQGDGKVVLVIVPRFLTCIIKGMDELPLGKKRWEDSSIVIPEEIAGNKFRNIFTEDTVRVVEQGAKRVLTLGEVFANFSVAMLEAI